MKTQFILALTIVTSISIGAFASEPNLLSAAKFNAVADAAITQHVVNEDESIKAIILDRKTGDSEIFVVQGIDASGKCYMQAADVYVSPKSSKVAVSFPRMPRSACQ